jgi:outer membrane lipoprotein-sorting protein
MRVHLFSLVLCVSCFYAPAWGSGDIEGLIAKMEKAYAGVRDYQAEVEIRIYRQDGSLETEKFTYTFKKPKSIRLDFISPHPGMVVIYPDPEGRVVVYPLRSFPFLYFHLAPDSPLLKVPSGQRIDQTDLGLLIKNIAHSLTDQRRGPARITEENRTIRIQVVANDHFRKGIVTSYLFIVDKALWLPIGVEERTPEGRLERTMSFHNLKTNVGVPDRLFHQVG